MRIAVVSDLEARGGAAIAASHLCRGMAEAGAEVQRFVWGKDSHDADTKRVSATRPRDIMIDGALQYGQKPLGPAPPLLAAFREWLFAKRVHAFRPDVVHLHNLHGAKLGIGIPRRLRALGYPVAWTLHDMWAFTGGCVYAYDCGLFYGTGCDATCPIADRYPFLDPARIRGDFDARRTFYRGRGRDVVIVTPSRWMAGEAQKGMLGGNRVEVIPNGFDLEVYRPMPADAARRALGLSDDAPIVLSGAQSLDDPRKGAAYLKKAIDLLAARRKVRLITYGSGGVADANAPVVALGTVGDDRLMRLCYAAADVFVLPTLADNLPNVLVEAAACGTPSVAFDVGGVGEVIQDGKTGFLARPRDSHDLADKLERILALTPDTHADMRAACRASAEQSYDRVRQGEAYLDLFASMTRGR